MTEFGPSPEESPSESEIARTNLERVAGELDNHDAAVDSIETTAAISKARWHGTPASEVVAMFGGIEEVERRAGSNIARELQDEIKEEGE
jgi:hypothetical protein